MVMTSSTQRELGIVAPNFALPDFAGRIVALGDFPDAKALLVVFWSNHCPFVKHIKSAFAQFAREYQDKGLAVVAESVGREKQFHFSVPSRPTHPALKS